jgi:predicted MFS family arabinose efflux permease
MVLPESPGGEPLLMAARRFKPIYFLLEGLKSFAATYYSYYLYFYMKTRYGLDNKGNLLVGAFIGFIYMFSAVYGGKFAQKKGYFPALKLGFGIMFLSLCFGFWADKIGAGIVTQLAVIGIFHCFMCFTWPTLEALVSENESYRGMQTMIGIYNVVWALTGAIAYFVGGAMVERFGLSSLFWIPAIIHASQFCIVLYLQKQVGETAHQHAVPDASELEHRLSPVQKKSFLTMAWIANPAAYIAINTVVAVIPGVADKFHLSPTWAGVFCSLWFFSRVFTFVLLWLWPGWHYRFRWFVTSYALLIASFVIILIADNLRVVFGAQIVFGFALGLIYYSSLFYSMDAGSDKGSHGGLHEAAIGAGIFVGPAIGAASLQFFKKAESSTWGVALLLLIGLAWIIYLRIASRATQSNGRQKL